MSKVSITSVRYLNYKALKDYSLSLNEMNIMVGPNNSGKSTVIGSFRLLEIVLKVGRSKSAGIIKNHQGKKVLGYVINEGSLPFSLENAHHNYTDESARIEFNFSNKNKIILYLPFDGGLYAYCETLGSGVKTPSNFKKEFPYLLQTIPVLGPLEQEEKIVSDDTVKKILVHLELRDIFVIIGIKTLWALKSFVTC